VVQFAAGNTSSRKVLFTCPSISTRATGISRSRRSCRTIRERTFIHPVIFAVLPPSNVVKPPETRHSQQRMPSQDTERRVRFRRLTERQIPNRRSRVRSAVFRSVPLAWLASELPARISAPGEAGRNCNSTEVIRDALPNVVSSGRDILFSGKDTPSLAGSLDSTCPWRIPAHAAIGVWYNPRQCACQR
jgi:hypothetical protein